MPEPDGLAEEDQCIHDYHDVPRIQPRMTKDLGEGHEEGA